MAQLKRTGRSRAVKGVGYARRGVIHTVPDDMVDELLKSGEWEKLSRTEARQEAQRVTEPAPSQPAEKTSTKSTSKSKKS